MKRIQWVAVSVCFVLAVTLWFLVTLNKQSYTTSFDVPVKLTNFPDNLQLLNEFPQEMRIYASGPGIKLLYQDFDPMRDTVFIDFDSFKSTGYFSTAKNLRTITQSLKSGLVAVAAEPDTIHLTYAIKSNKKVAVKLDVEFDLPASYRVPPNGLDYPDSVLVVGPLDSLAKITELKTVHVKLPYSTEPQVIFVPLDSIGSMQMLPNSIRLRYSPQPYTEKEIRLPVRALDVPVGAQLHFSPDTIIVKFLMPLDKFESVKAGNIMAEVSFEELDGRSNFVVPHILNIPPDVSMVSFAPKMLRYMLITQE